MRKNLQEARKGKGLTQQAVADHLGISLRYYKMIEAGTVIGAVELWDSLEDLLLIHQRTLREIHPDTEDSRVKHQGCQRS